MKLTPQQQKILTHIQRGCSNKTIAQKLGISVSTVKLHITKLFQIFAVRTRAQLALFSQSPQQISELPRDVEPTPFAWVHCHGNGVVGIVFRKTKPKDGWLPLYIKRSEG